MIKMKRKHRITHSQFCSIFTSREFTRKEELTKCIYMVEDIDGNYRIEEHPTILGYVIFSGLIFVMLLPVFLYEGVKGLSKLKEEIITLLKRKPLRADGLHHNIPSTAKLLELTGWYN